MIIYILGQTSWNKKLHGRVERPGLDISVGRRTPGVANSITAMISGGQGLKEVGERNLEVGGGQSEANNVPLVVEDIRREGRAGKGQKMSLNRGRADSG